MKIKEPKFAGYFYPASSEQIEKLFKRFDENINQKITKGDIFTGIVPHAGIIYSGFTAFHFYKLLKDKEIERVVVIGPSHHHLFDGFVMPQSEIWNTPFGKITIDKDFLSSLKSEKFIFNENIHNDEHSVEVQSIFLRYVLKKDFLFVPLIMSNQSIENSTEFVEKVSKLDLKKTIFIASSDLYHGNNYDEALQTDKKTVSKISSNDYKTFYDYVVQEEISGNSPACGFGPITTILILNKKFNVKNFIHLHHITSADVTNDYSGYTVGYTSFVGVKDGR
ncbi:MAG: MEMO1 family protein [candidate division TA06 bacterium 32_111]|uniref:MEMO1 family protein n=1 Tax=candidate division TA06 bacterium 34_109 TaxID=1635277 RepID=A0A101I173_UNCT6|nr:MAG: MEMO1 family protein [candidate division TA06 bacterium 32_111]KUK86504.1 MAG: MEMO1 family protein [candidate division TA06 bacterium 34_109]